MQIRIFIAISSEQQLLNSGIDVAIIVSSIFSQRGPEAVGSGDPRHGGVNPTFSPYDEVWTWIPIVRNSSENCRSYIDPVERSINVNERNRDILRNLRLPSYNEAVGNRGNNVVQNIRTVPSRMTSEVTSSNHVRSNQNSGATNHQTNIHQTGSNQISQNAGSSNVHQNETIQINRPRSFPATRHMMSSTNQNNNVAVMSASGSALQEARALVNELSLHALDSENSRVNESFSDQEASTNPRQNPQRNNSSQNQPQVQSTMTPSAGTSRGGNPNPQQNLEVEELSDGPSQRQSPQYSSLIRQTSYSMYPGLGTGSHGRANGKSDNQEFIARGGKLYR